MKSLGTFVLVSATLVASSTASADEGDFHVGAFVGAHLFSKDNELGVLDEPNADSQANGVALGIRGAYRLIDSLSLELELGLVPTKMRDSGESSVVYLWRVHGLYEFLAPTDSFRPFALAGAGFMSTSQSGDRTIADHDLALYAGAGATYALSDDWSLRGDARLILPPSSGGGFAVTDFEVLVGASFSFGGSEPQFTQYIVDKQCVDGVGDGCPAEEVVQVVDTDADGIADEEDACPSRAGKASADALRNGCPPSSEKLVVLPDENGHVGGVEVDDGTTVILVDKAYASAEVGDDGKAQPVAVAPAAQAAISRAITTMAVLPPADSDEDGVKDRDDACPDRKGEVSSDPLRNGCPAAAERVVVLPDADGHIGGLEIDNGTTKVIVDKAYASAEVGSDGSVAPQPPSVAPVVIDRAIAAMALELPPADRDGDGIEDEADACPARKGQASKNARRNGCPMASEVVVVLPDEDGHVGGVEVDDGVTKTVLDTAFATTEVGSDGKAHSVPPAPPARVLSSLESVTATMPRPDSDGDGIIDANDSCRDEKGVSSADPLLHGCPKVVEAPPLPKSAGRVNFTVYFDEKAQPTRDVEEQIVALLEEIKGRDSYSIEVVGHTDATGSDRANLRVGLARANEIAKRLVARGVPTHRVGASTRGSSEPAVVVANATSTPEPRNRRVEIRIKEAGLPQIVVLFVSGTTTTRSMGSEYRALRKRLRGLKGYKIVVVGHVDASETEPTLALKRANEVAGQLRKAGLPPVIQVVSKDASEPAVDEGENQALNRRVEIFINE